MQKVIKNYGINSSIKILYRALLFSLLYFLCLSGSWSQSKYIPGSPFIRKVMPEEYNSVTQNFTIVQDHTGIIYVGNNIGILEYDGDNWKLIETEMKRVRSLAVNQDGIVFVGAMSDLGYIGTDSTGKTRYISMVNKLDKSEHDFGDVHELFTLKERTYFITNHKIFLYDNDTIKVIFSEVNGSPWGNKVHEKIFVTAGHRFFWINKDKLYEMPLPDKMYKSKEDITFATYDDNKIIMVQGNSFYLYDLNKINFDKPEDIIKNKDKVISKFNIDFKNQLKNISFYQIKKLKNGYYLLTSASGLVLMDKDGSLLNIITENEGLNANWIRDVYEDKNHYVWLPNNKGISIIDFSQPITKFDKFNGHDHYNLSFTFYNNNLYVGTFNGGVRIHKHNHHSFESCYSFSRVGYANIWKYFELNGRLIALRRKDIAEVNGNDLNPLVELDLDGNSALISSIFPNTFFLGKYSGINAFKYETKPNGEIKTECIETFDEIKTRAYYLIEDNDGNIWHSSNGSGIISLKFHDNDIHNYTVTSYDTLDGLPLMIDYNIVNIDRKLFIFTHDKEFVIVPNNDVTATKEYRLAVDNTFRRMLPEGIKIIRVDKLDKNRYWIIHGEYKDSRGGLLTINKNGTSYWMDGPFSKIRLIENTPVLKKNILWINSNIGIFRADLNHINDSLENYEALVRKVVINNDSIIFHGSFYDEKSRSGKMFMYKSLKQPECYRPVLSFKNNGIRFAYSANFFEKQFPNKYSYKLENFDDDWSNWSNETVKEYTNLPGRKYIFRVRSKNVYNKISKEGQFKFEILPPWYLTLWAYIGYVILSISLVSLVIKIYVRRLKAANVKLEKIIMERTKEIRRQKDEITEKNVILEQQKEEIETQRDSLAEANATKDKFFSIISHDLKSPFNSLLGFCELLDQNLHVLPMEKIEKFQNQIFTSAKFLYSLVENLLSWSRARSGKIKNYPKKLDLYSLIESIIEISMLSAEKKNIEIQKKIEMETFVFADENLISTAIRNLLSNAIKFSNTDSTIKIKVIKRNRHIEVSVIDSGVGIKKGDMDKLFRDNVHYTTKGTEAEKGTGLGLILCKEFVEKCGGKIWVESEEGKGTTFTFTLPKYSEK